MKDKNGKTFYTREEIIEMGYSKNALSKRFYDQLKGKKPEDFGITWFDAVVKRRGVSKKDFKKYFEGVLKLTRKEVK